MTGLIKKSSVLAAVCVGLFANSARAQGTVEVKVPFPFVVAGEEFPAGHYDIRADDPSAFLIRNTDDGSQTFALTMQTSENDANRGGEPPALVFTRAGNEYL